MKRSLMSALFVGFFLLLPHTSSAFQAQLEPEAIDQGDPFVLRVLKGEGEVLRHAPRARVNGGELVFSGCGEGCFLSLATMPLDTAPGTYPVEVAVGGKKTVVNLEVREGSFPLQELTLPEGKVTLSPEDEERATREAAKLRAFWPEVSERLWEGSFIMPLENSYSTQFGTKRLINGTKNSVHTGLDIRGASGAEVKAANSGRVALAEELFFGGNTLVIDHGQGIYTIYMHLSGFNAEQGELVAKGRVVGFVGSTGRSTGPHLHYGVKVNAINTNPVSLSQLPLSRMGEVDDEGPGGTARARTAEGDTERSANEEGGLPAGDSER